MNYNAFLPYLGPYDVYSHLDPFLAKLYETANLPCGWRFGQGIPPTKQAVTLAKSLYQEFSILRLKADVFPGADGSLSLVFYANEISTELDISPEGVIDLYVEEGDGFDFQEMENIPNASVSDVTHALLFLAGKTQQWHFLESSTQETMTPKSTVFAVNVSSIPRTGVAFPWLTAIASSA